MPERWRWCPYFLAAVLLMAGRLHADAIVVTRAMSASTIAELFVARDAVRVDLEIGVGDLEAFRNLLPDELYERLGHPPRPLAERLEQFLTRDWMMRADGGPPLAGRLTSMAAGPRLARDGITGEALEVQPEDAEVVVRVTLVYPLVTAPATLSICPPLGPDAGGVAANIGFVAYHLDLPVNDFRYLSQEETLDLDWQDPWYSRFRNRNLRRRFDAPLSVFLYVEHFEVRKEIVIRPRDAQHWIDLGLQGRSILPVAEQAELKRRIGAFLADRGVVHIDGQRVEPVLDRVHFLRRTLRRTGVIDPPEDLDLASATLGVIFVYPIEKLPQEATVHWDLFTQRIKQVRASAVDEAGGLPSTLTPEDPTLHWQNFLTNPTIPAMVGVAPPPAAPAVRLPLISAACGALLLVLAVAGARRLRSEGVWPRGLLVGCGVAALCAGLSLPYARVTLALPLAGVRALEPQQAREVLAGLLQNTYRAFDWRDDGAIYDRLALSITGELLSEVFLQTRRSMELEGQGGARVKVDEVEILDARPAGRADDGGFVYRCRWNVSGSVGHWGHIHRRTNQYDAVFTVAVVEGAWRIAAIDLREERRADPGTLQPGGGA